MKLYVVEQAAPPPLPRLESGEEVRRPGELYETVALDVAQAQALSAVAGQVGVAASSLLAALVEAELLRMTLRQRGLEWCCAELAGEEYGPCRVLSAAEAEYLRTLTIRRAARQRTASTVRAALPVRIMTRIDTALLSRALEGAPEPALRWETHAVMAGSTLGEWGLARALVLALAGGSST